MKRPLNKEAQALTEFSLVMCVFLLAIGASISLIQTEYRTWKCKRSEFWTERIRLEQGWHDHGAISSRTCIPHLRLLPLETLLE